MNPRPCRVELNWPGGLNLQRKVASISLLPLFAIPAGNPDMSFNAVFQRSLSTQKHYLNLMSVASNMDG